MNDNPKTPDPGDLSIPEKILHVQDLWDDIARCPQAVQLTPEQCEEAERRLRTHESAPREYSSWEAVRHRLEGER
jgi:putative addiction module component (TIGR02574 family)